MNEKMKAFVELYKLINFYYENRDRPINDDFEFYKELEKYCTILGFDSIEFIKEFKLT
jgi:hypothetical protein